MTPSNCPIPTPPPAKPRHSFAKQPTDTIYYVPSVSIPGYSRIVRVKPDFSMECCCPARVKCRHIKHVEKLLGRDADEPTISTCRCGQVECDALPDHYCPDCGIPMADSWKMNDLEWEQFCSPCPDHFEDEEEFDFDPSPNYSFCACGERFVHSLASTQMPYCQRCKGFINEVWRRPAAVASSEPVEESVHPLTLSLLAEYGGNYAQH